MTKLQVSKLSWFKICLKTNRLCNHHYNSTETENGFSQPLNLKIPTSKFDADRAIADSRYPYFFCKKHFRDSALYTLQVVGDRWKTEEAHSIIVKANSIT